MATVSEGITLPILSDLTPLIVEPVTIPSLVIDVLGCSNPVTLMQNRSNHIHAISIPFPNLQVALWILGGGTMWLMVGERKCM
jgi:hypothetical protein